MSTMAAAGSSRLHNKSGKAGLSMLGGDAAAIALWFRALDCAAKTEHDGLCETPCKLLFAQDGRLTVRRKKVCYAYQLVAYRKFGKDALSDVPAAKTQDDPVISHLCGTRNCVVDSHLVLEPKRLNDERTYCHYAMANIMRKSGKAGVKAAMDLGLCNHDIPCGSEYIPVRGTMCGPTAWQKVGDENPLYNRKLQGTPGKSVTTAAGGPTPGAAGVWRTPDRKNVAAGGVKRPDPRTPLGQSAAKLPRGEEAGSPTTASKLDDSDDDFVVPPPPGPTRGRTFNDYNRMGYGAPTAAKP